MIDLGWLDPEKLIDISTICNTLLVKCNPQWRQFGIHLTDEVCWVLAFLLLIISISLRVSFVAHSLSPEVVTNGCGSKEAPAAFFAQP